MGINSRTRLLGVLLLAGFLVWFVRRSLAVWRAAPEGAGRAQSMLEKTAILIIALLLAHSLVDYPLRTTALGTIFAFCCAILASPAAALPNAPKHHRRQQDSRQSDLQPAHSGTPGERWDGQVQWPESWRRPNE